MNPFSEDSDCPGCGKHVTLHIQVHYFAQDPDDPTRTREWLCPECGKEVIEAYDAENALTWQKLKE